MKVDIIQLPEESYLERLERRTKNELLVFGSAGFPTKQNNKLYALAISHSCGKLNDHRFSDSEFTLKVYDYVLENWVNYHSFKDTDQFDRIYYFLKIYKAVYSREYRRKRTLETYAKRIEQGEPTNFNAFKPGISKTDF